jgi:hypothetical protein
LSKLIRRIGMHATRWVMRFENLTSSEGLSNAR